MSSLHRYILTLSLPLFLVVGWQMGVRWEQAKSAERMAAIDDLYTGQTGSGVVMGDPEQEVNIALLWHVWRLLQERYLHPEALERQKLAEGVVEGMVRAVGDPYTVYMSPKENKNFRDDLSGSLEGIGAELTLRDELIVIVSPIKGSPAAKAGLLPEDIITQVDGELVNDWSLAQVVEHIRGPQGTTVRLQVYRKGKIEPLEFSIVRQSIHIPSVESVVLQTKKGPVGHLILNQFGDDSIIEVRRELSSLQSQKITGLILDLRGNGGGYLEGAIDLVSFFLSQGRVVSVESRTAGVRHYDVTGKTLLPDIPLVLLQNEGTASASEITAGSLQDYKRATVIGTKSFGKGTVQEVIDVPGGGSLRVTIARWLTPNGKDLGKEGVHPDIEIKRTADDYAAQRDPQLDAAIEWFETGKVTAKTGSGSAVSSSAAGR